MTHDPFASATPLDDGLDQDMPYGDDRGDPYDREAHGDVGPDDGAPSPHSDDPLNDFLTQAAAFELNDDGNGKRFALYFGEDLMCVPRVSWFSWTGKVWAPDPDELEVRRKSQLVAPLVKREVFFVRLSDAQMEAIERQSSLQEELDVLNRQKGEDGKLSGELQVQVDRINVQLALIADQKKTLGGLRAAHRRFAVQSGNSARMKSMREEAAIRLSQPLEALDANDLDINCENGVLRFTVSKDAANPKFKNAAVELVAHERNQLLTKIMPVAYDPDAECPEFDKFFARIQPDPYMRAFLMRWFALSMTARVEQKLCFFYGMGANGKSVLIDLMASIFGDYAANAKIESLTGTNRRGGGDATPDLVQLVGARFVRASEPDEGMRWQEGLLKELTGGEPMLVRALHSDFIAFKPTFSLTISGNHKPDIRGTDDGIWRRLLLVPFDVQIPPAEQIPKQELDAILFAERAGIFAKLARALADYLELGLMEPDAITAATAEFRSESDPFGTYLDEACVVTGDEADTMTARELVNCFHFWLLDRAEGAFKDRTVSKALAERSRRWQSKRTGKKFTARKSNGSMRYDGIKLTDVFKRKWDYAPKDNQGRALAPPDSQDEA
jgi:putative DNA primase/helicase